VSVAARAPIGRLLVDAGVLGERRVDEVLAVQAREGGRFCTIALRLGLADERALVRVLSRQLGVPGMVLADVQADAATRDLLGRDVAERRVALPVRGFNRTLTVLMRDPTDEDALAELQASTGKVVRPLVALEGPLRRAIARLHADVARRELDAPPIEPVIADVPVVPLPPEATLPPADSEPLAPAPAVESGLLDEPLPLDDEPTADGRPVVLAVDDEPTILRLYEAIFDPTSYHLVTCGDGAEVLPHLRSPRPDVVLLDALLPGLHGFEVCRRIKQSDALRSIGVILLSGGYRGWQMRADLMRQCGADDFLEKPFDPGRLRERVDALLAMRRTGEGGRSTRPLATEAVRELSAGLLLLQKGDLDAASEAFGRALQADPNSARPHFYLGKIFERRGRAFEAMSAYEQAVRLDAAFFPAIKDLAILYQANGFAHKAIELWQQALAVCPEPSMRHAIKEHLVRLL
jgi:DNA-binding response OmpR family regulator